MPSKIISIKESLYHKLRRIKKPGQSFSDIIEELIEKVEKNPLKHFGIGKNIDEEIMDELESFMKQSRKQDHIEEEIPEWVDEWL